MKYKLETIPVWDAFDADSECPFCLLERKAEKGYLKFFLGNSVMVPEMRVEVNGTGFCRTHYPMLYNTRENRHALGLLTHTRLQEAQKKTGKLLSGLGSKADKKSLTRAAESLGAEVESCMICSRLSQTLARYSFTTLYLWKKDEEGFRERYAASKGFCLYHLQGLLSMAAEVLPAPLAREWCGVTARLQSENGSRLEEELFRYTQKFDFQNEDLPWENAKDALERGVQKLTGKILTEP
jgi:Family of unknown function (DUF6062)